MLMHVVDPPPKKVLFAPKGDYMNDLEFFDHLASWDESAHESGSAIASPSAASPSPPAAAAASAATSTTAPASATTAPNATATSTTASTSISSSATNVVVSTSTSTVAVPAARPSLGRAFLDAFDEAEVEGRGDDEYSIF